jgi:hypothetical protein
VKRVATSIPNLPLYATTATIGFFLSLERAIAEMDKAMLNGAIRSASIFYFFSWCYQDKLMFYKMMHPNNDKEEFFILLC